MAKRTTKKTEKRSSGEHLNKEQSAERRTQMLGEVAVWKDPSALVASNLKDSRFGRRLELYFVACMNAGRIHKLTPREIETMDGLLLHDRATASANMGISPKTADIHVSKTVDKLNLGSLALTLQFWRVLRLLSPLE